MRHLKISALVLFASFLLPSAAFATGVADYTFAGQPGNEVSVPIQSQPTGATFSDLTRGTGITPASAAGTISSSSWNTTSLDTTAFYAFGFTLTPGFSLSLTDIDAFLTISASGPLNIELRSSLDSFSSTLFATTLTAGSSASIDVSLPGHFQNLTQDVTFQLYAYNAPATAGVLKLSDQNASTPGLIFQGSLTAAPSPSSATLTLTALLPTLLLRPTRRQQKPLPQRI